MTQHERAAQIFVELADRLVIEFDVLDLLHTVAQRCVDLLHVSAAGLVLAGHDGVRGLVATSSEQPELLDLLQLQAEQGPGAECLSRGEPILCGDLGRQRESWPDFAPAALDAGYAAAHAVPMRLNGHTIGTMNLLSERATGLVSSNATLAQALADVATVGVMQQRAAGNRQLLADQLQATLNARIAVEQAKGVLAELLDLPVTDAFSLLHERAKSSGESLQSLAARVVDSRGQAWRSSP
ncbi:GAF and ANTAR domain-containing protein [Nonomuraea soli]|uniref:Transcriptional regulator with GAF, ATPase, and Fis domain n=1 Tax=Nonomuraea soli TaxID=1032476 RepID=A0A7W0HNW6_9ACTN|nr:GAF and ANTAR domain-containing protein [Nonomuraea soli]MBA2890006.1 transcriptional regulator with GAF, ATPase, and Fis domain [Nonomuraea soli]